MSVESFRKQVPIPLYDRHNARASFKSDATVITYASGIAGVGIGLVAKSAELGAYAGGGVLLLGLASFGLLYLKNIDTARRKELKRIIERAGNFTSGRKRTASSRMRVG